MAVFVAMAIGSPVLAKDTPKVGHIGCSLGILTTLKVFEEVCGVKQDAHSAFLNMAIPRVYSRHREIKPQDETDIDDILEQLRRFWADEIKKSSDICVRGDMLQMSHLLRTRVIETLTEELEGTLSIPPEQMLGGCL